MSEQPSEGPVVARGGDVYLRRAGGRLWVGYLGSGAAAAGVARALNRAIAAGGVEPEWLDAPDAGGWWWLWKGGAVQPQAVLVQEVEVLRDWGDSRRCLSYAECGVEDDAGAVLPTPGQKWLPLTPPAPPEGG